MEGGAPHQTDAGFRFFRGFWDARPGYIAGLA